MFEKDDYDTFKNRFAPYVQMEDAGKATPYIKTHKKINILKYLKFFVVYPIILIINSLFNFCVFLYISVLCIINGTSESIPEVFDCLIEEISSNIEMLIEEYKESE